MHRQLLSLVMIVKDEARGIRETLESARPHIDRYTILDTGSTDGTQAIVREVMAGMPGHMLEEPFVDFGTTRSRALDLAGTDAVFTLMLSGDETVHGGEALRRFCEEYRDEPDGAYFVKVRFDSDSYDSARLARTDAAWRYVGVTHEVLTKPGIDPPVLRVPRAHIHHDHSRRTAEGARRRWRLDRDLLTAAIAKDPADPRPVFYLAQTEECLAEYETALAGYRRRVAMGGWPEEVYEAKYRIGRVLGRLGRPWPEVQQAYLDAHAFGPHRAEPLFAIAQHWYGEKNWPLTFLFASRGAAIPYPEYSRLFVDDDTYAWRLHDLAGIAGYYLGEFEAGETAARRALAARPDDPRLARNLMYFLDRKGTRAA